MTTITASLVKELREKTGAGMMDCKAALTETKGEIEAAVDWLRKKGLSKAATKAGRVAAEGLIGIIAAAGSGAMVEVNSETDFVARNGEFQQLVRNITQRAPEAGGDLSKLLAMDYPGKRVAIADEVKEKAATIGENISVRRTIALAVAEGQIAAYLHNRAAEGLGKLGVLVALESKGEAEKVADFGRRLAMHIAAASPAAVSAEELDPALIERERAVYTAQATASGKPAAIAAKIVEGRLRKEFYQQVVLLQQTFLGAGGDGKATVAEVLSGAEKAAGAAIRIARFARYALGEGIARKDGDFAAEVAAAAQR
jgi:elongation factor Ts